MSVICTLCSFTIRQFGIDGVEGVVRILGDQFSDRSQKVQNHLIESSRRAWRALELALAGETFFSRFDSAADRALREQIRAFVKEMPLPGLETREEVRRACLGELREARNKGLLLGPVVPGELEAQAGKLARFGEPHALMQAEKQALYEMAVEVQKAGYNRLAWLLNQPASADQSVVVAAVRFFFRRAVERDPQLFRGLQFTAVENLAASQKSSFESLSAALAENEDKLERHLDLAAKEIIGAIGAAVDAARASIEARVDSVDAKVDELKKMHEAMMALLNKLDMHHGPLAAKHTGSMSNERDRQALHRIESDYSRLSAKERAAHPELLSDLGRLQLAAGELTRAKESFRQVAELSPDARSRAEAHHNAYRAALEQGDYDGALREALQAAAIDPARYAMLPQDKYEVHRILGAGGFGVTLLCTHRLSKGQVAVKSLTVEDLERDPAAVLQEAHSLDALKHRNIISLRDCGYADAEQRRPYLVLEYFPGKTLEEHVKTVGTLHVEDARQVSAAICEALKAAHGKNILHRDIKPANVLLSRTADGWEVRVIDFGLAMRQDVLTSRTAAASAKSVIGNYIAGTRGFAAPEQLGELPGVRVGPTSDVFGFGRTLSYMLFGVGEPTLQHYKKLPDDLADLLGRCLTREPSGRPQSFDEVLMFLRTPAKAKPVLTPVVVRDALEVVEAEPVRGSSRSSTRRAALRDRHDEDRDDRDRRDRPRIPMTDTTTRVTHAAMAFFLGAFGVHKYNQGNSGAGLLRIILTCTCVGAVYCTIPVGIIEAIIYLCRSNETYHDEYIRDGRSWF